MSLTINNDSAIGFALIALSRSSSLMNEAMERLSTGKRINSASDVFIRDCPSAAFLDAVFIPWISAFSLIT